MPKITSENLVSAKVVGDIPDLKPGQILVSPFKNVLYDDRTSPIDNFLNFPDWFKALDPKERNFKRCQGTQDYLNTGMTFVLPADVTVRKNPMGDGWESRYETPVAHEGNPFFTVQSFHYTQTGPIPATEGRSVPTGQWIKIVNPWETMTAPGWSCLVLPVLWEQKREWSLMPGVVHTDFYHHINWVLNIFTDKEKFTIPAGTKIAHIIPFPRGVKTEVLFGDSSVHDLINGEGMGSVMPILPESKKNAYRREQRRVDKSCPVFHNPQPQKFKLRSKLFRLFTKA